MQNQNDNNDKTEQEVRRAMENVKSNVSPSASEKLKLVRYFINHEKYSHDKVLSELSRWPAEEVEKIIKDIERENQKPLPKRYYVSLKGPLDDAGMR